MLFGIVPTLNEEVIKNRSVLKLEDIQILREWNKENEWLPLIEDSLLALFLHSNYYDLSSTMQCIEEFFKLRFTTPEFFLDWDLKRPDLQKGLQTLYLAEFPPHPETRHRLIFHGLKDTEPKEYVFRSGVTLLFMTIEAVLHLNGTSPGYEMIFSCKGVKLGHVSRVNLKLLKKFCHYVQEASPLRLKAIHVLYSSSIMDKVLFLLKPFVKKEILDLIHFYPGIPDQDVWENLPKSILPEDFGGTLERLDILQEKNTQRLLNLQDIFTNGETLLRNQVEKNNKNKYTNKKDEKKEELLGEMDIRNLELD